MKKTTAGGFHNRSHDFGHAYIKIINGKKGEPADFEFVDADAAFLGISGLTGKNIFSKKSSEVLDFRNKQTGKLLELLKNCADSRSALSADIYSEKQNKYFDLEAHYTDNGFIFLRLADVTGSEKSGDLFLHRNLDLKQVLKNMLNAFVVWESVFDENGKYVSFRFGYFNDAYEKIAGVKREAVYGKDVFEVWPETEKSWVDVYGNVAVTGKPRIFEMYHGPTNGWYHCNAFRPSDSNEHVCVVFEDITESKNREEEIKNLNRTYTVISQINQMIVRVQSKDELFRKACEIIIDYGKFKMAWIGLTDDKTGRLIPYTWCGSENGYLEEIERITIIDEVTGRGPSGTCIRENRTVFCNEIDTNPMMKPWRKSAIDRDFHSSIALPICLHGKVIGALTVYSSSPQFFDNKEVRLHEEITDDISYALENLEIADEKKIADKMLKESEEKYRTLVEISTDAIFLNVRDSIVYLNSAAVKLFGAKNPEELIGKSPVFLYDHEDKEMIKERIRKVLSLNGPAPLVEEKIRRLDGKLIDIEVSATPFMLKGEKSIHVIMRDISEKKQKEKELIEAKEKAEEMSHLKSNFLANMSHELRTPMVAILGFTEFLSEKLVNEENRKMADYINKGAHRLMNTLNMILDLSRIESSGIELVLKDTDLSEITGTSVELYRKEAENKNLNVITEIKPDIRAEIDTALFEKILDNLIQNAIIYTKTGDIRVSTGYEDINNTEYAFVEIRDTGIGIPEDKTNMIFEPFRQVSEGLNRKYEGTGLGLSITKKYVELMNGSITVSSRLGVGSVFTVRFKSAKRKTHKTDLIVKKTDYSAPAYQAGDEKRILLVEDDELNAMMINVYLSSVGEFDHVYSGEDAVDIVKKKKYSLILMDIGLKQMNGIEALAEIRKIEEYKDVPVVAVTAFAMVGDKEKLLSYGFDDYLSKPFTSEEIFSIIKKYHNAN